ncbi:flagellar hook-associated protein FlgK [Actinomadura hibisca]|uniref:flagellar hook-associated protein FlgK n=1 Tax=Actinomadura hibisca TaxID=68565 RepID=UPI00082CF9D4|nr:flagellar hook-associated protein FlgK [Actinomadura hibisca]
MSTFSGISTSLSALYAARTALDVSGQNIANVNTDGYTRQRVDLSSVGGSTTPAVHATSNGIGGGVTVNSVTRVQDAFLQARAQIEHARSADLDGQAQVMARVEELFGEPSDTGLQSQLSDFWGAWHDVVNQPGTLAARAQLLQRGGTVADSLNTTAAGLSSLWDTTRGQATALVAEVNSAATGIAEMNQAIVRATASGLPANELSDKRDQLALRLAELTGSTATVAADGTMNVTLGGASLVSGGTARSLSVAGPATMAGVGTDPAAKVALTWTDGAPPAEAAVSSGSLATSLRTLNDTLPGYRDKLDSVAASVAGAVNKLHTAGYDLDGAPGKPFFTGTTAATIAVGITEPGKVAASAVTGGGLDAGNADAIAALAGDANGPDALYRSVVTDLGVESQNAKRRMTIQDTITRTNDAQRAGTSGVSLDEEVTNMLLYQRAYQAASQAISTIDSTFDSLLSMMRG